MPFQDDLNSADNELFGLEDFQHYKESPELEQMRQDFINVPDAVATPALEDAVNAKIPMMFVSKISDPYTNLAIEDYIFQKMPIPEKSESARYKRLLFYVNSPCVVVGKNQNPWKEANIPLLNSLHIPLLRRKSGGGTVVHDSGNVNFSFMTTKSDFNRFSFVNMVVDAVNNSGKSEHTIKVNDRGDIVTIDDYKVSGSAYKLAKGRSYHHGTMLLDLKLDILGQLLATSREKNGLVEATSSVASVKSKVKNIGMENEDFMHVVSDAFREVHGADVEVSEEEKEHNEMLGLEDFVAALQKMAETFVIDEDTVLADDIITTAEELRQWSWKYGSTPKFTHQFCHDKLGVTIKFVIGKHAVVEDFIVQLTPSSTEEAGSMSEQELEEAFIFLRQVVNESKDAELEDKLKYKGSEIAGFITNDELSDWLGMCIDGSV